MRVEQWTGFHERRTRWEDRYERTSSSALPSSWDQRLYEGSKNVVVPAEKVLKVTVETDQPEYRPSEKVTYSIAAPGTSRTSR